MSEPALAEPVITDPDPFLTVPEVAARIRSSDWFVRKLINEGRLDAVRISPKKVLIATSAVESLLTSAHVEAP